MMQFHSLARAPREARFPVPFPDEKPERFHRSTLCLEVRNSG